MADSREGLKNSFLRPINVVNYYHGIKEDWLMVPKFGEYIYSLRIQNGLTLRAFCRKAGIDSSNWSKIERGFASPPKANEVLTSVIEALGIEEGTDEAQTVRELAAIGSIPSNLLPEPNVLEKLPVFFRTVRGDEPTEEDLQELINLLRKN